MFILIFYFRLIDNLPAATKKKVHKDTNKVVVYQGYRLGGKMNDQAYINNYLNLKLSYHKHGESVFLITHTLQFHRDCIERIEIIVSFLLIQERV